MNNAVILSNNNINECSFKNIVISTLGSNSAILINKKLVLTLGIEKAWFLSFLIDQYKFFENRNQIDIDGSFYTTDESMSLYTTFSIKKIAQLKKEMGIDNYVYFDTIGYPTRTKVVINFEKIFELLNTDKTQEEIAIKNKYYELEGFSEDDLTEENLKTWRKDALKIFCKKNRISYRGHDPKEKIIEKILKAKNTVLTDVEPSENTSVSSYAKTGELVTPKWDNQLRQNGSTSYAKMGVHNTYYKYILNNTSSSDGDEFFEKEKEELKDKNLEIISNNFENEKGKIKTLLSNYGITINNQIENSISNLSIDNDEVLYEYIKNICEAISKNTEIKYKNAYFLSCISKLDEGLYENINTKITKKYKERQERKEKLRAEEKEKKQAEEREKKFEKLLEYYESLTENLKKDFIIKVKSEYLKEHSKEEWEGIQFIKSASFNTFLRIISKYCFIVKEKLWINMEKVNY